MRYNYREEAENDILTETTEIIFYEMPKLEKQVRDYLAGRINTKNLSDEEKWCIYMKYRHEEQAASLIGTLCREEEGIMRAEKALTKVDRDNIRAARKIAELKNHMDRAQIV